MIVCNTTAECIMGARAHLRVAHVSVTLCVLYMPYDTRPAKPVHTPHGPSLSASFAPPSLFLT